MIQIRQTCSRIDGSCNGCRPGSNEDGPFDVAITEITLSTGMYGATIRLCDTCFEAFKQEMAEKVVAR